MKNDMNEKAAELGLKFVPGFGWVTEEEYEIVMSAPVGTYHIDALEYVFAGRLS